jgi:hypothetical protein
VRQKPQPRLVQQPQQGIIAHVPPVVDVRDPHLQLRAENERHALMSSFTLAISGIEAYPRPRDNAFSPAFPHLNIEY